MKKNDTKQYLFQPSKLNAVVEKLNNSSSPFRIALYNSSDDDVAAYGGFSSNGCIGRKDLSYLRSYASQENYAGTSCSYILYDKNTGKQVFYFTLRKVAVKGLKKLVLGCKECIEIRHALVNQTYRLSPEGREYEKNQKIGFSIFSDFVDPLINEMARQTRAKKVFLLIPRRHSLVKYTKERLHFKPGSFGFLISKVINEKEKRFYKYLYRAI